MDALILAAADVPPRRVLDDLWPGWAAHVGLVIAADAGARHAAALGFAIDLWVGDGDSIDASVRGALAAAGVAMEPAPREKDETDTELAIHAALGRGAGGIILLGATGGPRIDHALANLGLLAMPELSLIPAVVYSTGSRIVLLRGASSVTLVGQPGDLVSLLPFGEAADGVTTEGLRYPLRGERLRLGSGRGVSNVVAAAGASVGLGSGLLLIVETPVTIGG